MNDPDPVGLDWLAPDDDWIPPDLPPRHVPLLIVDVVGTIIRGPDDEGGGWVNGPADVSAFHEATALMVRWHQAGGRIVAVSNWGGVALGHVSHDDMIAAMVEVHRQTGSVLDDAVVCPHHPDAADPDMADCWCRKPKTAMPLKAVAALERAHDDERYAPGMALFVGDRPEDEECAGRLGIEFMWADTWRSTA